MPVMNGIEATHAILDFEKEHGLQHIPIIALTANALKGDRERFLAEGMDEYISKPIKLEIIETILTHYFQDKLIGDNNTVEAQSISQKRSVDILLCKQENQDIHIFSTLLKKIGYSVDTAMNIVELKKMMHRADYKYVLLDRSLEGLAEDDTVSTMLKEHSIQSILFVEDLHLIRKSDHENYTNVVLNVPNMEFLRNIILKLNPSTFERFNA